MARRAGAAIDLGSTSVHLLVAGVERDGLVTIADESTFLGLGAAVDGSGSLGAAGRTTLAATVLGYVEQARAAGAAEPIADDAAAGTAVLAPPPLAVGDTGRQLGRGLWHRLQSGL